MFGLGSCIIRRGYLVGVDVALLEEVCHYGWALRSQMRRLGPVSHSLPAVCQSQLLLQDHVCLCSAMMTMD